MVMNDWSIKVGDFGLTRFLDTAKRMTKVGTPMWYAVRSSLVGRSNYASVHIYKDELTHTRTRAHAAKK